MSSLRARFTILLIGAILAASLLASFVTAQMLRRPSEHHFDEMVAEQAEIASLLLKADISAAARLGIPIGPAPDAGTIDRRKSDDVSRVARQRGHAEEVVVLWRQAADADVTRNLAIRLADGRWAYLGFPAPGPFPFTPLVAYLALVALGTTVVALYAVSIMMRPLSMLEDTVTRVGSDGVIPDLPETGPVELRATARAINRLSSRLNTAIASRMRLVAAAGHDMRTPMTRMRLRAEFVADPDDRRAWFSDLEELDHMADSAIRLVREEVGGGGGAPLRLDVLLDEIVGDLGDMGLAVSIAGTLPEAEIVGTAFALKRALRNLLVNAGTHGIEGTVSLVVGENSAVLTILDQGPGIPPELTDRVFEPFFRVDQARRQMIPGAGLGLAIAREIIEKHGGTIDIANRDAVGLEQIVRLPLHKQV